MFMWFYLFLITKIATDATTTAMTVPEIAAIITVTGKTSIALFSSLCNCSVIADTERKTNV